MALLFAAIPNKVSPEPGDLRRTAPPPPQLVDEASIHFERASTRQALSHLLFVFQPPNSHSPLLSDGKRAYSTASCKGIIEINQQASWSLGPPFSRRQRIEAVSTWPKSVSTKAAARTTQTRMRSAATTPVRQSSTKARRVCFTALQLRGS